MARCHSRADLSHGETNLEIFCHEREADGFIADQIRNLKHFGTVSGKTIDLDAYKWNTVDEILSEIGVTPLEAATHYVALVKRAGSVAKLGTLVEMGRGVAPPGADLSPSLRELATHGQHRQGAQQPRYGHLPENAPGPPGTSLPGLGGQDRARPLRRP